MRFLSLLSICALLLVGCDKKQDARVNPEVKSEFDPPLVVPINLEDGYNVNLLTGDSIEDLLNDSGEVLVTGKRTPFRPDTFELSEFRDTTVSIVPEPIHLELKNTSISLIKALDTVYLDSADLTIKKISDANPDSAFVVWSNDSIKTGVELKTSPQEVDFFFSTPLKAPSLTNKELPTHDIRWLDVEHNMNTENVHKMLTDSRGQVWMAFNSDNPYKSLGSLARFDGQSFQHVMDEDGLFQFSRISFLFEDSKQNIWIGSSSGLYKYDGFKLYRYGKDEGFIKHAVNSICEDKKGKLWMGFYRGFVKFQNDTYTCYGKNEGLSDGSIQSMSVDADDRIWIFGSSRICVVDDNEIIQLPQTTRTRYRSGLSMHTLDGGVIYCTQDGLLLFRGFQYVNIEKDEGLDFENNPSRISFRSIIQGTDGVIWAATNSLLFRIDGERVERISTDEGLVNQDINCLTLDSDGNVLIGHKGSLVSIYYPKGFKRIQIPQEKIQNVLIQPTSERLLCTTKSNAMIEVGHEYFLKRSELLESHLLFGATLDENGGIWAMGTSGINRIKNNQVTQHSIERKDAVSNPGFSLNSFVYKMKYESPVDQWFFGIKGLSRKFHDQMIEYSMTKILGQKQKAGNARLFDLARWTENNTWIGVKGMLVLLEPKKLTRYSPKEGMFLSESVSDFVVHPDQSLWFGDGLAICRYDRHGFTYFSEANGLSKGLIHRLQLSPSNEIWVSTSRGFSIISTAEDDEFHIQSFDFDQMLLSEKTESFLLDGSRIVVADDRGSLVFVDTTDFMSKRLKAQIAIKSIHVNQRNARMLNWNNHTDASAFKPFESVPTSLELNYDENNIKFGYSCPNFSPLIDLEFQYRVEGWDKMWSDPTTDLTAEYRNMGYGDFKFQVRAREKKGQWGDATPYSFTIHPPWFHTWWARSSYAITGILLVLGFVRWRTSSLKKKQEELEQVIEDRTSEVVAEKEKSDALLLNILPAEVAEELKERGHSNAQLMDEVTVLFTDFKGFTSLSEQVTPKELVKDLHECFSAFDNICAKYGIEKIKTIGDAYMAAGGLPRPNDTHAVDVVKAAFEMRDFVETGKARKTAAGLPYFEIRIGVHTGPVVAGIVGVKKFQYDIWGDTVNTASRMESSGEVGKVNISQATYELLKDDPEFAFENRGKIEAKGKGEMEMYFVSRSEG